MNRNYQKLPKIVHDWLWLNKAWIVGTGVDWYLNQSEEKPKDLDIIIPFNEWGNACKIIDKRKILNVNSFGGFKSIFDDCPVDFWPTNLEDYLTISLSTTNKITKALRLNPYTLITANKNE